MRSSSTPMPSRPLGDGVARTSTIMPLSGYTIRQALLRRALPRLQEAPLNRSITRPASPDTSGGRQLVTLDGRYDVVGRIASGGMGEVFRARDTVLAREVAIKVLHRSLAGDQAFVDRFRTEARAAAGLSHPNIVAVFDWGSVDGIYYMVMEYVRGHGLRALLTRDGRLEPAQATDVVRQTLLALEHAHRQGIVHRDIKPENVLITTDGVAKVADFGLARAYAEGRQTQAGTVTGTVQYLAPEQIRGEPADPRSDLYSLGIVTYELLTGKLPFTGETAMSIAYKHLSGRVPHPSAVVPAIPAELDGFVASATDRDREMRPESAVGMRRDLDALAPSLPPARSLASLVDATPEPDPAEGGPATGVIRLGDAVDVDEATTTTQTIARVERSTKRRWRRRLGILALVAALVAIGWGVWTYLVPHRADVPAVVGVPLDQARDRLSDLGFAVRIADPVHSERIDEGLVLRVQPVAGTSLERGEPVTLVPSLGAPPVRAPDVERMTLEGATTRLERVGLGIEVARRRHDAEIPEGSVIEQLDNRHGARGEHRRGRLEPRARPGRCAARRGSHRGRCRRAPEGRGIRGRHRGNVLQRRRPRVRDRRRPKRRHRGPVRIDGHRQGVARTGAVPSAELHRPDPFPGRGSRRRVRARGILHRPAGRDRRRHHAEPGARRDRVLRRHDPALPAVRFGAHVRRGSEATAGGRARVSSSGSRLRAGLPLQPTGVGAPEADRRAGRGVP